MKKILVYLILLVIAGLLLACAPSVPGTLAPSDGAGTPGSSSEKGRVFFTITDAAADMNEVTSLKVTVDNIQVHSASEGWVIVSSTPKTYDLLELKSSGSNAVLAEVELPEGTYQQVRLEISEVTVIDSNGEHNAKLPSSELKIVGELVVNASSTSTASFDFIADESLHLTGNGDYILAPVVQLETRVNAEVSSTENNTVKIYSGMVKTKTKVGMDIEGKVGLGLRIRDDAQLSIENGKIKIGLGLGSSARSRTNSESEQHANASTNAGVNADISIN